MTEYSVYIVLVYSSIKCCSTGMSTLCSIKVLVSWMLAEGEGTLAPHRAGRSKWWPHCSVSMLG